MQSTSQSLLGRIRSGPDGIAWQRWHSLYEPLIHGWLSRYRLIVADRDDITQNVLAVVVRRLPEFEHNGRVGAFRHWLKSITIFCLRDYWKSQQAHPRAKSAMAILDNWADDRSELSQIWDLEHDRHIMRKLLALLRDEFSAETWAAFQGVVIDAEPAAVVAARLKISPNAVYIAKSRVLSRLRHEAAELIDDPAKS